MPSDLYGAWSDSRSFTVGQASEAYSGTASITATASISTAGRKPQEGKGNVEAVSSLNTSGYKSSGKEVQIACQAYALAFGYPLGPGFWSPPESASGSLSHVFTNLKPSTKYKTEVRSKMGPVHSGWSGEKEFETKPRDDVEVDITAVSQVETSGFKQTEAEIQVTAVSDIAALHLKGIEAGAAVSAVSQVQTERHKGQIYQVSIQESAQLNMVGAKGFETAIQIEAQEGIQTARVKNVQADVVIEGASSVDTEAFSSMPQDEYGTAEISAAGATASAGDKSARSAVSISSQGQIMTTGIAALLDLGIPQNVQAMGISLSEIQLSWDEVLSADGYEYRFREKVL